MTWMVRRHTMLSSPAKIVSVNQKSLPAGQPWKTTHRTVSDNRARSLLQPPGCHPGIGVVRRSIQDRIGAENEVVSV
jgi:hypothetical protein